jgi:hypothetical protein
MNKDIQMIAVKGKQLYITDGFVSRQYSNDRIITMTLADPMIKQPGRILNPIKKALVAEGADCYINKQQAGPAGSVFIEKDSITADTFHRLFNADISDWL